MEADEIEVSCSQPDHPLANRHLGDTRELGRLFDRRPSYNRRRRLENDLDAVDLPRKRIERQNSLPRSALRTARELDNNSMITIRPAQPAFYAFVGKSEILAATKSAPATGERRSTKTRDECLV